MHKEGLITGKTPSKKAETAALADIWKLTGQGLEQPVLTLKLALV